MPEKRTYFLFRIAPFFILVLFPFFSIAQQGYILDKYDISNGLSGRYIRKIYQDKQGFLWIGTIYGLDRFDGQHIKSYPYKNKHSFEVTVTAISEDHAGNILVASIEHGINKIRKDSLRGYYYDSTYNLPFYRSVSGIATSKNGSWFCSELYGLLLYDQEGKRIIRINKANSNLPFYKNTTATCFILHDKKGYSWIGTRQGLFRVKTADIEKSKPYYHFTPIISEGYFFAAYQDESSPTFWFVRFAKGKFIFYYMGNNDLVPKEFIITNKQPFNQSGYLSFSINGMCKWTNGSFLLATSVGLYILDSEKKEISFATLYDKNNKIKNGLIINGIVKTSSENIVWLATEIGLLKVDLAPRNFRVYNCNFDHMPAFKVRCMAEISKDMYWVGTQGSGIYEISLKNDRLKLLKRYKHSSTDKYSLDYDIINHFFIDRNKNTWIGMNTSLDRYDQKKKQFRHYEFNRSWFMCEDKNNYLWVGTNGDGLGRLNKTTGERTFFIPARFFFNLYSGNKNSVWYFENYNDQLLMCTNGGVIRFDKKQEKFLPAEAHTEEILNMPIWYMVSLKDGKMLLPTHGKGLWLYDPLKNEHTQLLESPRHLFGAEQDSLGNTWIITDPGLIVLDKKYKLLKWFTENDGLNTDYFSFNGHLKCSNGSLIFCGGEGFTLIKPQHISSPDTSPVSFKITSLKVMDKEISDYLLSGNTITLPYHQNVLSILYATGINHTPQKVLYKMDNLDKSWRTAREQNELVYADLNPGNYVLRLTAENSQSVPYLLNIIITPPFWKTWWFRTLISSVLIALLCTILITQINRQKLRQKLLKSEIDSLRLQMNPHFIFNSLNSIQNFIYTSSHKEASIYLAKFARLMRNILENSNKAFVSLEEEISFLQLYLELESVRLMNRFTYTIRIADDVDAFEAKVVPMLVQPILENALKHGFDQEKSTLHIELSVYRKKQYDLWSITDNGIGRKASSEKQKNFRKHKSFGLNIVESRLALLNKTYNKSHYITYTDLYDQSGKASGTRVDIFFEQE